MEGDYKEFFHSMYWHFLSEIFGDPQILKFCQTHSKVLLDCLLNIAKHVAKYEFTNNFYLTGENTRLAREGAAEGAGAGAFRGGRDPAGIGFGAQEVRRIEGEL